MKYQKCERARRKSETDENETHKKWLRRTVTMIMKDREREKKIELKPQNNNNNSIISFRF